MSESTYHKVPEEKKGKGPKKLFGEIVAENFPNLVKKIGIQVYKTQKIPNKMSTVIRKIKVKKRLLKVSGEKQFVKYKENAPNQQVFQQKFLQTKRE